MSTEISPYEHCVLRWLMFQFLLAQRESLKGERKREHEAAKAAKAITNTQQRLPSRRRRSNKTEDRCNCPKSALQCAEKFVRCIRGYTIATSRDLPKIVRAANASSQARPREASFEHVLDCGNPLPHQHSKKRAIHQERAANRV